jgi:hypothetical protein
MIFDILMTLLKPLNLEIYYDYLYYEIVKLCYNLTKKSFYFYLKYFEDNTIFVHIFDDLLYLKSIYYLFIFLLHYLYLFDYFYNLISFFIDLLPFE